MAPPTSIAALGDSITRGFNASGFYVDWPSRSWSTGTESGVNSIYQRLLASEPAIAGNNFNLSQSGAKMVHLNGQAADAVASDAELVTILMGANDVCTSSEATMTPASTYRAQFATAMNTLSTGLPDTRVFVASIPDVHRLWEVGHTSFAARTAWGTYRICQSLLASPTSTATADVERRERVRQRVVEYNAALRDVCAEHVLCTYDDDAAFEVPFVLSDLSGWDYFHPNRAGQTKAAAALWPAVAAITTEPPTAPAAALVAEPAG
ncbi:MAG: SGNH/GDSL hydrolase family protein [Acidimicrobiia bacterium]|nr:SGNH/GDSL hydrolase family protein [Acidimicrobiia bacterium]